MDKQPESSNYKPPPPDLPKGPPPGTSVEKAQTEKPGEVKGPDGREGEEHPPALQVKVAPEGDGGAGGADDASLGDRVVAAVIDFVIAIGLGLGATWLLPSFLERSGTLLAIGYLLTRDSLPFLEGQSVGKKAMGIRAVTSEGGTLAGNWQPGLVRNAVLLIPLFAVVELFVLISRQDGAKPVLRLGDEWAKTKVVKAKRPQSEA